MILFLSDVHTQYDIINRQIAAAEAHAGTPVAAVVVLGDFGLFEPHLHACFRRRGQRILRPLYFIEGNHEDFDRIEELIAAYRDFLTYLPRGTVQTIAGHRFLCFGGTAYMDAHTTPPGAVIRPEQIRACLALPPDAADIVLTHDCPSGVGVPNSPGFEHYGDPGFPGSRELLAHFRPRLWLFGHHHKWFDRTVGTTRFCGIARSWTGYGLLHDDGGIELVPSEIAMPDDFWSRLRQRLGL